VPPLLLQPLVENAVTHGIAHTIAGGLIRVRAERTGSVLRIVTENPCDPERPARRSGGVGLANVRARLRALHGREAALAAFEDGSVWRAEVTMPAVEAS
jgi:LytS/YehU family sensor histidine kinase